MATAVEIMLGEQIDQLRQVAEAKGWDLEVVAADRLIVSIPARDGTTFWLMIECGGFPIRPPAVHWYNHGTEELDQPKDTPKGGGYFHGSGVICAPWNRLAYRECNAKGPHGDWQLASWITNPKTGGTTTICAIVLRVFTELNGPQYGGRAKVQ